MEILDDTTGGWLVQFDDGTRDVVAKSEQNRLLMEHDLWGLLRDGSTILQAEHDDTEIVLMPGDDAREFTLVVGDYQPLHIAAHEKSRLVSALLDGKESGETGAELLALFDAMRENRVRMRVVDALADVEPFATHVEPDASGWLVHGYLLVGWDGEMVHPDVTSKTRSGSVVDEGGSEHAYKLSLGEAGPDREVTLDGETYRLTDAEMAFLAKTLWAIARAPREV